MRNDSHVCLGTSIRAVSRVPSITQRFLKESERTRKSSVEAARLSKFQSLCGPLNKQWGELVTTENKTYI